MKKIFIPLIVLAVAGCKDAKNNSVAEAVTSADTVVVVEQIEETEEADAYSSATSKPNEVLFNGTLVVPPEYQATVTMVMGGTVKSSKLLSGMAVKKGQLLVALENPDFIDLQQNYLDSHAQLEYLEAEYNRQLVLSKEQAASQKKLQQAKAEYLSMKSREQATAAQLQLLGVQPSVLLTGGIRPYLEVLSPIDGYVGNVRINAGKHIAAGEALCDVINKDRTMLRLVAYEKDLSNIHNGDTVEFTVNGIGAQVFRATLISVGQQVDEASRSLEIYARVDAQEELFRPGMYVTARILHQEKK